MSHDAPEMLAPAWPPGLRRRLMARFTGAFDGGAPLEARYQPGAEAFTKCVFELDRDGPRVPEGQSIAYLRLLQRLWLDLRARRAATPVSPREAWLQRVHAAVIEAHVLERELLGQLEREA